MAAIRIKVAKEVVMNDSMLHYNSYVWGCTDCGYRLQKSWKYCPRCGSRTLIQEMKEEQINESKRKAERYKG